MSGMSRRDLLRASAGAAAVAVPMSVLASEAAGASGRPAAGAAAASAASIDHTGPVLAGPVVFSVVDARAGEVSILHGTSEVIVRDPDLVTRIMRAARRAV